MFKFLGIALALVATERFIFPIILVKGPSMSPTYKEGDWFLSCRVFNPDSLSVGDVVVFPSPVHENRMLVKRISRIQYKYGRASSLYVLGDNTGNSMDSREFGYIPADSVKFVALKSRDRKEV